MIKGMNRIYKLSTGRRIPEEKAHLARTGDIVEFAGMGKLFSPLRGRHALIRDKLWSITRPKHVAGASHNFGRSITLHVRLGDFQKVSDEQIRKGRTNSRISLSWYIAIVEKIREELKEDIPVYLFSDGQDEELRDIYKLGGVTRMNFGSAIADIWGLSRSTVLVASGSTFSMWGSYLGQMPTLWYPGQFKGADLHGNELCGEIDSVADLPDMVWQRLLR
ncbi:alpha-1,2-fucosyltransferase [Cupriavidus sp. YAF13]|uniref:alpha-1,2-fucosyltransferase n=1 Tax=Cupriavidus sp. YAF13 TaxID=3233075 RepID=UPI003F902B52